MMVSQRIAFIDSRINIEYINEIMTVEQKIGGVFTINDNKVVPSTSLFTEDLTHATMCAKKFLDNFSYSCDLVFIEILDDSGSKANINSLLIALEWCLENSIKLINLSIGTTSFVDIPQLHTKINNLVANRTIIVSASSNRNKMTFPAFFSNVIGVRALGDKLIRSGFEYDDSNIDGIEISCYISNEVVKYKDKYHVLPCTNSLAAPAISAKVCSLINEGCSSLYEIKTKLKEQSLSTSHIWQKKMYLKYFKEKINIPIIAIIEDDEINLLVQKFLSKFEDCGYSGICISENYKTDILIRVINLLDFESYDITEKLHFYSHYCNVDYVIVHIGNDMLKNLKLKDIDVVINNIKYKNQMYKQKIQYITFQTHKDFDSLFTEVYNYLSKE